MAQGEVSQRKMRNTHKSNGGLHGTFTYVVEYNRLIINLIKRLHQFWWELNLNRWDVAAGMLIAKEAGAVTESIRENRNHSLLASTPTLADSFRKLILP